MAQLAYEQHGVVSCADLYRMGLTRHWIHTRSTSGRLHRLHHGVYAVGHRRLTIRGRWTAAVLACGPGAALSHSDAAALHDLRRVGSGLIHVTAPSRHNLPGIRSHFIGGLDPIDVVRVDNIAVTSVARTFLDIAAAESRRHLAAVLEQAQREDSFDATVLHDVLARYPGSRGSRPLREALDELVADPPWTQSELERRFRTLTREHGIPPAQLNVYVEGELVDAFWPAAGLIVEVDSWTFHKTRAAFEADRARDAKLQAAGYRVIRITHRRMRDDAAAVAAQLRVLLGLV